MPVSESLKGQFMKALLFTKTFDLYDVKIPRFVAFGH